MYGWVASDALGHVTSRICGAVFNVGAETLVTQDDQADDEHGGSLATRDDALLGSQEPRPGGEVGSKCGARLVYSKRALDSQADTQLT